MQSAVVVLVLTILPASAIVACHFIPIPPPKPTSVSRRMQQDRHPPPQQQQTLSPTAPRLAVCSSSCVSSPSPPDVPSAAGREVSVRVPVPAGAMVSPSGAGSTSIQAPPTAVTAVSAVTSVTHSSQYHLPPSCTQIAVASSLTPRIVSTPSASLAHGAMAPLCQSSCVAISPVSSHGPIQSSSILPSHPPSALRLPGPSNGAAGSPRFTRPPPPMPRGPHEPSSVVGVPHTSFMSRPPPMPSMCPRPPLSSLPQPPSHLSIPPPPPPPPPTQRHSFSYYNDEEEFQDFGPTGRLGIRRPYNTLRISKWVNPIPFDPEDGEYIYECEAFIYLFYVLIFFLVCVFTAWTTLRFIG